MNLEADIKEIAADYAKNDAVTGVVVKQVDADFDEVWVTEYSRPFELISVYKRIK